MDHPDTLKIPRTKTELTPDQRLHILQTVHTSLLDLHEDNPDVTSQIKEHYTAAFRKYINRGTISTYLLCADLTSDRLPLFTEALVVATILARYGLPIEPALVSFNPESLHTPTSIIRTSFDSISRLPTDTQISFFACDIEQVITSCLLTESPLDQEIRAATQEISASELKTALRAFLTTKAENGYLLFGQIGTDSQVVVQMQVLLPDDYPTQEPCLI